MRVEKQSDIVTLIMCPLKESLTKMSNLRHQIKSQWYYIFWGACAVAVVGGQIYVGLGYREMAEATKNTSISVTCASEYTTPPARMNKTGEFE